jgi:hypothetical protein
MKHLKILHANYECKINQEVIDRLDLIELYVSLNDKIINVSFMKKLKLLIAAYSCGSDQNGRIRESRLSNSTCRLRIRHNWVRLKLNACGNDKITNVSFMKKFRCELYLLY